MERIILRNASLQAEVLAGAGAGLARLDWLAGATPLAVLRGLDTAAAAPMPTPSQLACFPMLPWSNRIGGARFDFEGRSIALGPNRPGEPCPIHGDGWQYAWQVRERRTDCATLVLDRSAGEPFSYFAVLRYGLSGASLQVSLEICNTGKERMPFGFGLHPWLPRPGQALLQAASRTVWRSGADKLPRSELAPPPEWDFSQPRGLPAGGVDNVFTGWDGRADIVWRDTGMALCIEADMPYYILYAPAGADFFCFEPVDHAINAHNLPGGAQNHGLTVLAPQQRLTRQVSFSVRMAAP